MSGSTSSTPSTPLLDELHAVVAAVAERVGPSVVAIGRHARGSGVVIGPDRVLTNAHNLRDRTTQVTFADGRSVQGSVVAADPHGDLVVIDADTADAAPVEWAGPESLPTVGGTVLALSLGGRGSRITVGLVSGTDRGFRGPGGRPIRGSLEHTAPLAKGSSGGPLVDAGGRLVGLNTHRLGEGFYLALAADAELRSRVDQLVSGRVPQRLVLGVALAPSPLARRLRQSVGLEPRDGLLVRGVDEGGPAAAAGVRRGDLLVGAAGRALVSADDLFEVLVSHDRSAPLVLSVVRGSDELEIGVSFAGTGTAADADQPSGSDAGEVPDDAVRGEGGAGATD